MSTAKKLVFAIGAVLLICVCVEAASWAVSDKLKAHAWTVPERTSFISAIARVRDSERFDPHLGWREAPESLDETGARVVPVLAPGKSTCIRAYGDSYTFGDEVADAAVWTAKLEGLLGCRVRNLGVSGYGPDQALLRYEAEPGGSGRIVTLGIFSENIVRIVNQNRSYIYDGIYMPKPRFVLDSGNLRLVPLTLLAATDYETFTANPRKLFPHEYFIPGGGYETKQTLKAPYAVSVVNSLLYKRVLYGLGQLASSAVPPWYSNFYQAKHPSNALVLMQKIIVRFDQVARRRGDIPVVVVFPSARDLFTASRTLRLPYQPLVDWLSQSGIRHFEFATALMNSSRWPDVREDICRYFCTKPLKHAGHYTEAGHTLFARMFTEKLHRVLPSAEKPSTPSASEPNSAGRIAREPAG